MTKRTQERLDALSNRMADYFHTRIRPAIARASSVWSAHRKAGMVELKMVLKPYCAMVERRMLLEGKAPAEIRELKRQHRAELAARRAKQSRPGRT
jgi:hypothetical protein